MSAIMKTMICPPSFCPDGFVATHAHGQTIHRVPKWTSCHKVIVVITSRAHGFHECIYYAHLVSERFEHFLFAVDHYIQK